MRQPWQQKFFCPLAKARSEHGVLQWKQTSSWRGLLTTGDELAANEPVALSATHRHFHVGQRRAVEVVVSRRLRQRIDVAPEVLAEPLIIQVLESLPSSGLAHGAEFFRLGDDQLEILQG